MNEGRRQILMALNETFYFCLVRKARESNCAGRQDTLELLYSYHHNDVMLATSPTRSILKVP